jgi:serine-type D-Ala-D-Ala carboxypeptidase/endopeptidase
MAWGALLASAAFAGAQPPGQAADPATQGDADVLRIIRSRVDAQGGDAVGMVVGIIGPQGRRVIAYGRLGAGDSRTLDGDTVFEIGSITKVFTALLLADMTKRGEVALTDPVSMYLPQTRAIGSAGSLTLGELATHTSGLPLMAPGADPGAARVTTADLYQALASPGIATNLSRRGNWSYSNYGYWLLGEALASRNGSTFEQLLSARVIQPLGLSSTAMTVSPELQRRVAPGHDANLSVSPAVSSVPALRLMPSAGSLVSTTNDLLTMLSVALGERSSPLSPALTSMLTTERPTDRPGQTQALGWMVLGDANDRLVVHDGGTLGYASAIAWSPSTRIGAIVLSNHVVPVSDIARHLVKSELPLAAPTVTRRTEIALDPATLEDYTGRFEASGEGIFTIAREGDHLTVQVPESWGLPVLRLRPESPADFFVMELPLRVSFESAGDKRSATILVYPPRGQRPVRASRQN